jgi:hypothetical protein
MFFQALSRIQSIKKEEFETSAQFEDRRSALATRAVPGRLSIEDTIAISVKPTENDFNLSLEYDADSSLLKLEFRESPSLKNCSVPLRETSRRTGAYIGQNAFGATTKVTEHEVMKYCVSGISDSRIEFSIANEKARRIKSNLRILLIGRLTPPYISESSNYASATISNPADVVFRAKNLHMKIEQIFVYDWASGEIIYRSDNKEISDLSDANSHAAHETGGIDSNGNNIIHQAIWLDRFATAERYIKEGRADLNGRNKFGATPLHIAVWKRQITLVKALLAAGADKSIKDNEGKTPLDDAKDKSLIEISALLR